MAAPTITHFFSRSSNRSSESDNVVLAPESINNTGSRDPDALIQLDEFKLQGEQYTRCSVVVRGLRSTKKRTSVIWLYGEIHSQREIGNGYGTATSARNSVVNKNFQQSQIAILRHLIIST
jgi:hypothetical protein